MPRDARGCLFIPQSTSLSEYIRSQARFKPSRPYKKAIADDYPRSRWHVTRKQQSTRRKRWVKICTRGTNGKLGRLYTRNKELGGFVIKAFDMEMRQVKPSESTSELLSSRSTVSVGSTNHGFEDDDNQSWLSKQKIHCEDIITLNVGGARFQTYAATLAHFPNSLLGDPKRRAEYYSLATNEYFFDRNRLAFDAVLECYRRSSIVITPHIPTAVFVRELLFYDLSEKLVEQFLRDEELFDERPIVPTNPVQKYVHDLFTNPDSSFAAKIVAMFDVMLVLLAITSMCVNSLPEYQYEVHLQNGTVLIQSYAYTENHFTNPFFCIELTCNVWFLIDLVARFCASPIKKEFFLFFMNVVDFISILPFFADVIVSYATNEEQDASVISFLLAFRILRMFRIFKVFSMDEYSDGLAILANTVKTAHRELGIMLLFLLIGMVFFGATIYYAERGTATDYQSIPASFWWSIITWTTIGYGDTYPKTPSGKVVGCFCAVTGVLCLGLIIPPVVRRFEHFFYREKTMQELRAVYLEHQTALLERKESNHYKQLYGAA